MTDVPRQFYILTNHGMQMATFRCFIFAGLYTAIKRRPVDILMNLLIQSNGRESEPLILFIQKYFHSEPTCTHILVTQKSRSVPCVSPWRAKTRSRTSKFKNPDHLLIYLCRKSMVPKPHDIHCLGTDGGSTFLVDDQMKSWALQLFFRFGIQSGAFVEQKANDSTCMISEIVFILCRF